MGAAAMRLVIVLIVIVYLIGVGVVLAPTVQAKWNIAPASDFAASVGQQLPVAFAWPVLAHTGFFLTADLRPRGGTSKLGLRLGRYLSLGLGPHERVRFHNIHYANQLARVDGPCQAADRQGSAQYRRRFGRLTCRRRVRADPLGVA